MPGKHAGHVFVMDKNISNSLIGGASGLLGSVVGAIASKKQQQREFQQQKDMLSLQNQFSLDMWNRENAYQDPSAQMSRMINAGINPNLAAAGIAGNGSEASSVQSSSAPGVNSAIDAYSSNIAGAVMNPLDNMIKAAQIKNLDQDTKNKEAENPKISAEKDLFLQRVENLRSEKVITDYEADKLRPYAEHADEIADADITLMKEKVNQIQLEIKRLDKQISLAEKDYDKMVQEIEESKERVSLMEYQEQLAAAEKRKEDSITALNNKKLELQEQGYDDSLEGLILSKASQGIDVYDDLKLLEKISESRAKGEYNADPIRRDFNSVADFRDEMNKKANEARMLLKELSLANRAGKLDRSTYTDHMNSLTTAIRQFEKFADDADNVLAKGSYKLGYKTFIDRVMESIIPTLVGIGIGKFSNTKGKKISSYEAWMRELNE